ncbi:histidine kinase N-terminal domain-containing protein [Bacillus sp. CGMCC 1.16607]|uniref:histidine kinase N-terminal domain-containing protein n=1 Tax=Bacillus sp. CGMCC 1.16607 TaxID=3351842 RepID=UPI003644F35F
MLSNTKIKLIDYLSTHREEMLNEWAESIIVSSEDPFIRQIRENGESMFNILLNIYALPDNQIENLIQNLAERVVKERVQANINIGDFVNNVGIGRTLIHQRLLETKLSWDVIQEAIKKINYNFDKFLYFAISSYTDAKNKIIEEKTQMIDSTHEDRLTLLGQMTSSFVHEFRNPLTSIQGFIQLIKSEYPGMKYLDIISNELEQLNFRISQFLLLSKKELIGKEKTTFSLNTLLEEVLVFLYPSILDVKVKIIKEFIDDVDLYGYADEIRQVLINIIFNAIDVLGHHRMEEPVIHIKCNLLSESFIQINIGNNGPKIPEELQKTIFEPFFTTKKLGTGLGLFVCREIIEKHKGDLNCYSSIDQTVFSIILPLNSSIYK